MKKASFNEAGRPSLLSVGKFTYTMKRIFKHIKNKFQQLKKPTENTKEIIKLSLWILGAYLVINLLPCINSLLSYLPSGLFLVLLFNLVVISWLLIQIHFDSLAVRKTFYVKNYTITTIYAIHTINKILFIGFASFHITQYVLQ
jgi:hypothetical protein